MEQSRLALIKEGKLSAVGELCRKSPLSEQSVDGIGKFMSPAEILLKRSGIVFFRCLIPSLFSFS